MYLAELHIENFRIFGDGPNALTLVLRPGLTALVGENDSGKTAIVDALRLALGTRDQEYLRVEDSDFHRATGEPVARTEIRIRCQFSSLSASDISAFSEYLTYIEESGSPVPNLFVNWRAASGYRGHRRVTTVEVRSGRDGDGPAFDQDARLLLSATYLRPLRDAERALAAGRGSRLSQILQYTKEVIEHGKGYDPAKGPPDDPSSLSILGIADFANALLGEHQGIQNARDRLNREFLNALSFRGSTLEGHISVSGTKGDDQLRLRMLLEKLELDFHDQLTSEFSSNRGLGSNNLLFMACELLLLASEREDFPLLLIEEPEAHLHPQRQLRLMQFLEQKSRTPRADGQRIQVIVSTHSPNLASAIALDNLIILCGGKAFPLCAGMTRLDGSDYGFLSRFLDATKANLFFARGVVIVEGDAENILLPTLARLLDRDFTSHGVSIVNVGGVGLRRFARIFQRKNPATEGLIPIPVACVADMDVMPDCAPEITQRVKTGEAWPAKNKRRWRARKDFTPLELAQHRAEIEQKASGQFVKTFVSDEWTFEYDLAYAGLARDVFIAVRLAAADELIAAGNIRRYLVALRASREFEQLLAAAHSGEEFVSHIYKPFVTGAKASKAVAAQYLASILEKRCQRGLTPQGLRALLPQYIVDAIDHVTTIPTVTVSDAVAAVAGTSAGVIAA